MPQRTPTCQLGASRAPETRGISPHKGDTQCLQHTLIRGTASQHIDHTASRRSGPRRWLRCVRWLIDAGLHPKTNATTIAVAEDLATRMDYDTGHARYCLDEMVARLGISKASVKRHVAYLRELGALAWVQHGTRVNVRRAMGLKGYAATATIYAAVIPPVFDHAMGHRIVGSGYTARIVIDQRGQQPAIPAQRTMPVDTPGNPPVDNPAFEDLEPPSLTWLRKESKVQVEGGSNYTEQARPPKTRIPHQSTSINGRRRTAADVQKAIKTTRLVRALVNWTQTVPLRRLEFVLRPWTDRGWDACRIADELNGMCAGVRWKPKSPVAFIRARIAQDTAHQAELEQAVAWEDSTAYREMKARASLAALFGAPETALEPERTQADRDRAQLYGWDQWEQVAAHYDEDPDDAIDLYDVRLCQYAVAKAARLNALTPAF
ncbi:cell wall protein [Streptomyces sp. NPDC057837]|uniref:cell wall protein n=1 Tax=Streptomyces sp. NPDC057837 TaxID=3346260 RepID=UPI0036A16FE8